MFLYTQQQYWLKWRLNETQEVCAGHPPTHTKFWYPTLVQSVTSSFSFYVTLLFASVAHIVSQHKALTLMKKNRITGHGQKWPHVHHLICELFNTQCCSTSHIGPMFTRPTGCTVIKLSMIFLFLTLSQEQKTWMLILCCVECVKRNGFISSGE